MATNPEKIKQEALASLEQLTEMAEARLKDQKITEWQVGTRPLSVPFLFRTSQSSWLDQVGTMIEELAEALATYQRANAVLLAITEHQVVEEQSKTELFINTTLHDKP